MGFKSPEAMVHEGYKLEPKEVNIALEWLKLNPSDHPVPINVALAIRNQQADQEDLVNQRLVGRPANPEIVDNDKKDVHNSRPTGNSVKAALRRLRNDRRDIHARVLKGELSANAGMIEAGFRKKRRSKKRSLNVALHLGIFTVRRCL